MGLKKHLGMSHQISEEEYEKNFLNVVGADASDKRAVKQPIATDEMLNGGFDNSRNE